MTMTTWMGVAGALGVIGGIGGGLVIGQFLRATLSPAWLIVCVATYSLLPALSVPLHVRRMSAATILFGVWGFAFCFIGVMPLWAGVAAGLAERGVLRQALLVCGVTGSWLAQLLLPLIAMRRLSRTTTTDGVAASFYVVSASTWASGIVLPAVIVATVVRWGASLPPALVVLIIATLAFMCRLLVSRVLLAWFSFKSRACDGTLIEMIADISSLVGTTFHRCLVLSVRDSPTRCEVRMDLRGRYVLVITEDVIARLSREELRAVVAHELKHVVNNDIGRGALTSMVISYAVLAVCLVIAGLAARVGRTEPTTIYAWVATAVAIVLVREAVEAALWRMRERDADEFAASIVGAAAFKGALMKLPSPDPSGSRSVLVWSTHDPLEKRLRRLETHGPKP
jgi:Zn-dependent protease with chaperone function